MSLTLEIFNMTWIDFNSGRKIGSWNSIPLKCQVLHITTKRKPIRAPYTIHGQTLQEVDSAKYLGVTLQSNLSWNQHIDSTAKKANNTWAFLQRNFQQCPRKTKELCYRTLIRPILDYASVVWDPFTEENIRRLEMAQRRAARMVFSDYRQTSSYNKSSGLLSRSEEHKPRYAWCIA